MITGWTIACLALATLAKGHDVVPTPAPLHTTAAARATVSARPPAASRRPAVTRKPSVTFQNTTLSVAASCNDPVLRLPCVAVVAAPYAMSDVAAEWRLRGKRIYSFDGYTHRHRLLNGLTNAAMVPDALAKNGDASLMVARSDLVDGTYVCRVSLRGVEGETAVHVRVSAVGEWVPYLDAYAITALTCLLDAAFWMRLILLAWAGEVSALEALFVAAEGAVTSTAVGLGCAWIIGTSYSYQTAMGLCLVIVTSGIIVLANHLFTLICRNYAVPPVVTVIQVAGLIVAVTGLHLSVRECLGHYINVTTLGVALFAFAGAVEVPLAWAELRGVKAAASIQIGPV
ncbi:immunoglobulin domain protein CD47-like [Squirrelpox virus]|uniref:Leukocyte surface antigen CD47 n=1 Tax=Squirrelpox virus TaxID=240426 RepID=Q1HTQ3_9POXV|nr:immunoglobulin domain protein CD47-like [Squirrelpox virus]ABD51483.1 C10R [Squirrelpox virus]CCD83315.1 immunoglobulin domain protein CD47-like [Squirrelpox virus]